MVEFLFGALAENPQKVGAELLAPFDGLWSARRGQFRIIYEIGRQPSARRAGLVKVRFIGHRSAVYRPR